MLNVSQHFGRAAGVPNDRLRVFQRHSARKRRETRRLMKITQPLLLKITRKGLIHPATLSSHDPEIFGTFINLMNK